MPTAAFNIDIREITRLADSLGRVSGNVVRNELVTAMDRSTKHVEVAGRARVHGKSGTYARSFHSQVRASASGVVGIVKNTATSKGGFMYSMSLEWGRKAFGPIKAKALRFTIGGTVIFAKWVKAAPAQHIVEFALRDAEPRIQGEFDAARDRIASKLERAL